MKTMLKILIAFTIVNCGKIYPQNKATVDHLLQEISVNYDSNSIYKTSKAKDSSIIISSNTKYENIETSTKKMIDDILGENSKNSDPKINALVELKRPNQFT